MLLMLADYLHSLDPILIKFSETIAIRWYGLAYIAGFLLGFLLLRWLARRGLTEVPEKKLSDFITYAAVFGVLLGGRLGYMFLYDFDRLLENPLNLLSIHKGGMASHGGFLGIALFTLYYAKRHKLSWLGIGDDFVVAAPIGLFFGRMANFINGELFGRPGDVPWSVRFPTAIHDSRFVPAADFDGRIPWALLEGSSRDIVQRAASNPELAMFLEKGLNSRHPSQLYEAALEGLLLFAILLGLRLRFPTLPKGVLTGWFFVLYALFRIYCETFRLPDDGESDILGLSKGQFYSTFMIVAGIAFLGFAYLRSKATTTTAKSID